MAVPFQRANGSAPEPDRGQNLTASPANTTGHAHVVKGQPVEILHAGLANSPYGENVGNWSHPSCVNGNEGLNGTNCSTSGTEDRNLAVTDPVLVNETTRVPAYFPVIHQVNNSGTPLLTEKSFRLTPDQHLSNNSDLSTAVLKSNNSVVRTTNYTTVNVTLFENGTTGSTTTPSGGTRRHKSYVISSQMKQHYKGVMQTILMEELKHGVWESKVPIEDGPFGSLIWRDKKYLISVLVPIGVGITGAVIIVVVAYAVRSYKRKQKRRAFTSPSRTFRPQAQLAIMDQVLLLDDSSDDEF
ncbi:uncharacterized protein LOC135468595 [Liolophura sinensis]|uniref:uncharacterized protein LOC135468595 n=1 Tax=Liolophura sinensis TaxID=3198878 RepID=UPI003158E265